MCYFEIMVTFLSNSKNQLKEYLQNRIKMCNMLINTPSNIFSSSVKYLFFIAETKISSLT